MKISVLELPDDPALFFEPDVANLPSGWASLPADRPSMAYGTAWLKSCCHLGLIVPSAVMQLERNVVLNPQHPAMVKVRIVEILDFSYDGRLFALRQ